MMDLRRFTKMHGLGNDFVVLDGREQPLALSGNQVRRLADRRLGVGCDQVIIIEPSDNPGADAFMRIRNADGSEAAACGNATRCVALLLMRETGVRRLVIETEAGLLDCAADVSDRITVDMGRPRFGWRQIPLSHPADPVHLPLQAGPFHDGMALSMGNPHVVFFVDAGGAAALAEWGPRIEHDPLFPQATNVEAVQVLDRARIRLRVWERGAGLTPACGSGACAAVVAGCERGLLDPQVTVHLDGGDLHIEVRSDGHVLMTGPASAVFAGVLDPALLAV
jgi:diaminopimelate epimerase